MNETHRAALRQTMAPFVLVAASLLHAPSAWAQSDELSRFGIGFGVFVTDRDSKTRLDGQGPGSGTEIDLESQLGLEKSSTVFRADGFFRFNDSHRLDFSVFDLSRNAAKRIESEIIWGDTTYPVDVLVAADFDVQIYKLAYTWSLMKREKGYLGLTGGLYVADLGTRLSADSIGAVSGNGVTAPLPVVGLRGDYSLSDKWTLRSSVEFFALEYGDYDGSLTDAYLGVDYQLTERMAAGLGINSVGLDIGVTKPRFNGEVEWRYTGALLQLKFEF